MIENETAPTMEEVLTIIAGECGGHYEAIDDYDALPDGALLIAQGDRELVYRLATITLSTAPGTKEVFTLQTQIGDQYEIWIAGARALQTIGAANAGAPN